MKMVGLDLAVVNHYKYQAWSEFKAKFRRRVSAYVVDWTKAVNPLSQDRAPGLGYQAVKPLGWETKFCEVVDERLKLLAKMNIEVQIVSRETIKPSPATNSHPKIFKLSALDQFIPDRWDTKLVLFYPMNKDSTDSNINSRLTQLKSSLSELLACFYPLAGKIRADLSTDCNNGGACFVETRVDCTLEKFLTQPDLVLINKFLPCEIEKETTFVMNVQVNVFECDGIAVGICVSHRIIDANGLRMFLKGWTSPEKLGFPPERLHRLIP